MPRDLQTEKAILDDMPSLSREYQVASPTSDPKSQSQDPMPLRKYPKVPVEERFQKMKALNPYGSLLSRDDLDECDWLEHATFEPHEAATREKVRLFQSLGHC
jgi:hypothetical protein